MFAIKNNRIRLLFVLIAISLWACKSKHKSIINTATKKIDTTKIILSEYDRIKFNDFFFEAIKQKALGNPQEALDNFSKALKYNPNSDVVFYEAGLLFLKNEQYSTAKEFLEKAYLYNPKEKWYQIAYAEALVKNKKFKEAANIYINLSNQYPNNTDYLYEYAACLVYMNKPTEAIVIYDKIESITGITENLSIQKYKLYLAQNKFEQAVDEIKKLIEAFPDNPNYYQVLGEIYLSKNKIAEALAVFNDLLAKKPNNGYVHLFLAEIYKKQGKQELFIESIKKAFENSEVAVRSKAKILFDYYKESAKDTVLKQQALDLCDIFISTHPKEALPYAVKGDFLSREKQLKEARTLYEKATEYGKDSYIYFEQLMLINSSLQDYDSLLKVSKKALELFPNEASAYLFNGLALLQLKKTEEAIKVFESALSNTAMDEDMMVNFYSYIGDAYQKLKKYDESDMYYEEALKINPKSTYTLNNYAYFLSLRKENMDRAKEMAKLANELEPDNAAYQDTYGWILYQMGKYQEAVVWLKKAVENTKTEPSGVILEHYGDVLYQLGQKEEALEYWKKAKAKGDDISEFLDKKINDGKLYE